MAGASPALSAESPVLDVRSCTWLNRGLPETVFPEDRVELKSQDADCYLCWMSQVVVQAQRPQVQPVICRFFDDTLVERLLAARPTGSLGSRVREARRWKSSEAILQEEFTLSGEASDAESSEL
jgi:hypothetical protein